MPCVVELGARVAGERVVVDADGEGTLFELDGGGARKGGESVEIGVFAKDFGAGSSGEVEEDEHVEDG